jgi:FkbM family methyltransferase
MFAREIGFPKFIVRMTVRQVAKRVFDRDLQIRLPNGYRMLLPASSSVATEIYVTRCDVDWGSERVLLDHLSKDWDFLDVGANIGYYSLYVAHRVRRVYAFEPDPRNRRLLEANVAGLRSISVIPLALSSRSGAMTLELPVDPARSRISRVGEVGGPMATISATTVDEFVEGTDVHVGGIKIDVEGHDLDVLMGAEHVMKRDEPLVLTEFNERAEERLFEFLGRLDYQLFAFVRPQRSPGFDGRKPKFVQLLKAPIELRYKMLFLVPRRLIRSFASLCTDKA